MPERRGRSAIWVRVSRSLSAGRRRELSAGTSIRERSVEPGTSSSVVGVGDDVGGPRLPVSAAISPKKSPSPIDDSERYEPSSFGVPASPTRRG